MQKAYIFRGSQYLRYDIPTDKVDDAPKPVNSWNGFPEDWDRIDAAVTWDNGKIYFFKDDRYLRFDILKNKIDQRERPIRGNWPGMPESWTHFDAAINWGNGKAYFFHGAGYARYDIALDTFDQPSRRIHTFWNGFPSEWSHIDAAVNWGNGKAYLFHRSQYVVYDVFADRVVSEKRTISDFWHGVPGGPIDGIVTIDKKSEHMGAMIESKAAREAVGFAYVIYEGPRMTKRGSGGQRLRDSEKKFPFTINTELGIGSITKMLTAMSLLKRLSSKGLSVDDKIEPFLPKNWSRGANISTITFRELLTHTSGFRLNDDDYEGLKSMIAGGIMLTNKVNYYRNSNFSLMRILIASVRGIKFSGTNADPLLAAGVYKLSMQEDVFEPSLVKGADCRLNSLEIGFLYGPARDPGDAFDYDDGDDSTMIAGAGGWKLTPLELARTIHTFFTTERILPAALRDKMISEGLGTDSRGHKNGFWDDGEKGYCNTFYIFQDDVQCVFMSNSMYTDDMTWPEAFVEGAHRRAFR
jgi:CubicO group peptidase (beta-lactamase class C family)